VTQLLGLQQNWKENELGGSVREEEQGARNMRGRIYKNTPKVTVLHVQPGRGEKYQQFLLGRRGVQARSEGQDMQTKRKTFNSLRKVQKKEQGNEGKGLVRLGRQGHANADDGSMGNLGKF